MAALSNIRITYQKGKGYKKFIGGRTWWLGRDEKLARRFAMWIMGRWETIQAAGGTEWSEADIKAFYALKSGNDDPEQAIVNHLGCNPFHARRGRTKFHILPPQTTADDTSSLTTNETDDTPKGPTVETALQEFEAQIRDNPQLSDAHKTTTTRRIRRLKKSMPLTTVISEVGHDEIAAIVRYWLSRPKSKTTGKKISLVSIKSMVATVRQFFYWISDTGIWTPPPGLKKLFSINTKNLLTNAERKQQAVGVQTFTVDDLQKLYANANERTRLFMLLGLNCGFAQAEISSLTTWKVKLNTENPRIERHRRKSDVYGIWPLWRETIILLKSQLKKTPKNENDFVITTSNGQALVKYSGLKSNRTDAIQQSWRKLIHKTPDARQLSFKYLRKTGANMIRKIAGKDISEAFLAHGEPGVSKLYTNADFERVAEAVIKVREQLNPMFEK